MLHLNEITKQRTICNLKSQAYVYSLYGQDTKYSVRNYKTSREQRETTVYYFHSYNEVKKISFIIIIISIIIIIINSPIA